jgi:hypothetical protein
VSDKIIHKLSISTNVTILSFRFGVILFYIFFTPLSELLEVGFRDSFQVMSKKVKGKKHRCTFNKCLFLELYYLLK